MNVRRSTAYTGNASFLLRITPANLLGLLDFANFVWIKYIFPIFIVGLPIVFLLASMIRKRRLAAS
ncbi:hypothetical protein [Paenibacillus sp. MMO-58]|uniref:hypothetical protein n=1 Tax=Paenibacillus sp. MMO-58 TaxID=3081290 RepID=UPI0030197099